MRLEANITRFAPTLGFICDVTRHDRAIAEAEDYDFRMISPGFFLCIHNEVAYAMSVYLAKAGCGCADMTFRCKGNEACKHVQILCTLNDLPTKPIDAEMKKLLIEEGWSGRNLIPPTQPGQRQRQRPGQRQPLPNIHDPDRMPAPQAAQRAESKGSYDGKSAEEIVQAMDDKELERNARKGGVAARAEVSRREAERAVSA